MITPFYRNHNLINIPQKKLIEGLENTLKNCETCSINSSIKIDNGACNTCLIKNKALNRYYESNIPAKYWNLEFEKDFKGDKTLLDIYKEITNDLKKAYKDGVSICLCGGHGIGKTFLLSNVLKRASEKGYTCLYQNLSDIVDVLLSPQEEKGPLKKELLMVDILVIDEFDGRHFAVSEKAVDLLGRSLEQIFRTRNQNALPILMATNSLNVVEEFQGKIKQSLGSLLSGTRMIAVLGKDFRKNK